MGTEETLFKGTDLKGDNDKSWRSSAHHSNHSQRDCIQVVKRQDLNCSCQKKKKKRQLRDMMGVLAKTTVAIILQYINALSQHLCILNCTVLHVNSTSIKQKQK